MSFIRVNEVGDDSLERVNKLLHNIPGGLMQWCWSMILLNLLCNCCCGGWGFHFRM